MEKMKRWKMVFLAIFMFVAIFVLSPSTVNAAQTEDGNYNYTVKEDGSVEITNYKGDSAEAQIPAEVDGKQVTSIGNLAFNNSSITSVTIPASIKSIGAEAFDECSSLAKIYYAGSETDFGNMSIGEGNDVIGNLRDAQKITYNYEYYYEIVESSFVKIKKYIGNSKNVVIPKKIDGIDVTSIEEHAFYTNRTAENIVIPYGVTKIGQEAFQNCLKLKSVTIPGTITSFSTNAFYQCGELTQVTIQGGATEIGSHAFSGCSKLKTVSIPSSVTSIGVNAFFQCTALEEVNIPKNCAVGSRVFGYCSEGLTSIVFPDGVTSIGEGACDTCSNLETVTISKDVQTIGSYAFADCTSLTDVYYTGTQEDWEKIAIYSNNTYLKNATIHYEQEIGKRPEEYYTYEIMPDESPVCAVITAYTGNEKNATIPFVIEGYPVASVGAEAFKECQCETIIVSEGIEGIDGSAFEDSKSLTSISFPSSLASFGDNVLTGCSGLTKIEVADGNSEFVAVDDNLYRDQGKKLVQYAVGKTDTAFTVPVGVTVIGESALMDSVNLKEVTISKDVKTIDNYAFEGCTHLENVNYTGTQSEWNEITIGEGNTALTSAKITYEYGKETDPGKKPEDESKVNPQNPGDSGTSSQTGANSSTVGNSAANNTTAAGTGTSDTGSANAAAKKSQPMKVKVVKKTIKASKLKKKARVISGAIKVTNNKGTVTFSRVKKGSSKALKINKKNGKITVKKGTKKGTYKIKVKVSAKGDASYLAGEKTVTVKIKVK